MSLVVIVAAPYGVAAAADSILADSHGGVDSNGKTKVFSKNGVVLGFTGCGWFDQSQFEAIAKQIQDQPNKLSALHEAIQKGKIAWHRSRRSSCTEPNTFLGAYRDRDGYRIFDGDDQDFRGLAYTADLESNSPALVFTIGQDHYLEGLLDGHCIHGIEKFGIAAALDDRDARGEQVPNPEWRFSLSSYRLGYTGRIANRTVIDKVAERFLEYACQQQEFAHLLNPDLPLEIAKPIEVVHSEPITRRILPAPHPKAAIASSLSDGSGKALEISFGLDF